MWAQWARGADRKGCRGRNWGFLSAQKRGPCPASWVHLLPLPTETSVGARTPRASGRSCRAAAAQPSPRRWPGTSTVLHPFNRMWLKELWKVLEASFLPARPMPPGLAAHEVQEAVGLQRGRRPLPRGCGSGSGLLWSGRGPGGGCSTVSGEPQHPPDQHASSRAQALGSGRRHAVLPRWELAWVSRWTWLPRLCTRPAAQEETKQ